jgi:tetratricopeptide (TPR) repeat protein
VAKTQFERAISLDPQNIACLRQYSWVLMMMDKKEEARLFSLKALRLNPSSRESQWHLIRIYMESEMYLQALLLLKCLRRKKGEEDKTAHLIDECKSKLEFTFEGSVLRILREGIRAASGHADFSIPLWREAERIWVNFCISKAPYRRQRVENKPHIWAAAVAYMVLINDPAIKYVEADEIFNRFQTTGVEVWPCIRHLQESMLKKTA